MRQAGSPGGIGASSYADVFAHGDGHCSNDELTEFFLLRVRILLVTPWIE